MRSHLASWIVVIGMATAMTGCASMKSPSGTTRVNKSDHHRLKRLPAMIAIVDGSHASSANQVLPHRIGDQHDQRVTLYLGE